MRAYKAGKKGFRSAYFLIVSILLTFIFSSKSSKSEQLLEDNLTLALDPKDIFLNRIQTINSFAHTTSNINEGGIWIMNKDGSNKQRLTKLNR